MHSTFLGEQNEYLTSQINREMTRIFSSSALISLYVLWHSGVASQSLQKKTLYILRRDALRVCLPVSVHA